MENNSLRLTPLIQLVQDFAGSISIPSRFKGLTVNQMIEKAKEKHFAKHKKQKNFERLTANSHFNLVN